MSLFSRISRSTVLAAVTAVTATALTAGCSFNPDWDTRGSKGVADFSMTSSQCSLFGCGLDKPVAQGASIRIDVSLTKQAGRSYSVRVHDAAMGTAKNDDPHCSLVGSSGSKGSDVPCTSSSVPVGSSIEIDWSVDIQTTGAGKLAFDVVDDTGAVVDSGSFDVHPAATIDTTVSAQVGQGASAPVKAGADGAFTVKVGAKVQVDVVVKDSSGTELAFTEHGVVPSYTNTAALKSDPNPFNDILGATDTEYALAGGQGDGAITFDAHSMTKTVSFHVVP